jgi:hypothetical protein
MAVLRPSGCVPDQGGSMVVFTLDEANALIPELRRLVHRAQLEMNEAYDQLKVANEALLSCEWELRQARITGESDREASELQADWQTAADQLTEQKDAYARHREGWVERITGRGVLLRDLQRGLIDFPAQIGDAEFFYCWVVDEEEITHWHSRQEGFTNRKPLDALNNWDGDHHHHHDHSGEATEG